MRPLICLALLGALLQPPALAASLELCRGLHERTEALAAEAMIAEISLVQELRGRLCPALRDQADGANAMDRRYVPLDYEALLRCRRRAEQLLVRTRLVLYRNRLGFPFYSLRGASLAKQADALATQGQQEGCPWAAQG